LARATQIDSTDWSTFSAYGVALDQTGNHDTARRNYEIGLKLSPANPVIETNVAMSYVLTGQLNQAETTLRRLVARPDATPQMRQNLAMIASLKGNAVEAEQLAREDLTADQANNNLTVLRQLDADNAKVATPAPEASLPAPETKSAVIEAPALASPATVSAETEAAPVVTATMEPAAATPAKTETRYQMTPIADDVVPSTPATPTPIMPKTTQKTEMSPPIAKPVTQEKAATQPAQKQSSMLRKSYGTQAPVSVANIAD
jgi:tetratricopeptide (TPR) repeat protein